MNAHAGIALRPMLQRHIRDERGQEVLTWLLILFVLWILLAGGRILVP